ncbi:MAG: DUF721 domain-containing protein [Candidatus Moranbacteria bacterium]|nr:DUF721 domain-containing protein [Candidatus Moranbacteria bacterium]
MWENFQKVLEKRVSNKKTIKNDKHLIISISDQVLQRIFGEISKRFIKTKDYKKGRLWVELKNSTWKSELKLNEKKVITEINKTLNDKSIEAIIIV